MLIYGARQPRSRQPSPKMLIYSARQRRSRQPSPKQQAGLGGVRTCMASRRQPFLKYTFDHFLHSG